jgi:hypothetical protein
MTVLAVQMGEFCKGDQKNLKYSVGKLLLDIHKTSLGCTVTPTQLTATKEQAFDLFPDWTLYLYTVRIIVDF